MKASKLPLIGIPATPHENEGHTSHRVSEKYVYAAAELTRCVPILIPAIGECVSNSCLLEVLDGIMLTGGRPNVEPHHYGGEPSIDGTLHCPERDATTLPLIRTAIERAIPIFAVCLGIQELNVAMGGTLHQRVQEMDGKRDHRMDRTIPIDERFEDKHPIDIQPGGLLEELFDGARRVMVNSLHAQAVDRPGDGVFVEALSDDGVIEAISVPEAPALTFGVQWHPEHPNIRDNNVNGRLFATFGDAVHAHCGERTGMSTGTRAA
jgi:putative glutamine amidotransferase